MTDWQSPDLALLAALLRERCATSGRRVIVGIVGAPGTGKSTFAERLHEQFAPGMSAIVPMDGFHLANVLIEGTPLAERKGAIDTMDAGGYVSILRRLRRRDEPVVFAPSYRRGLEEPIAASIAVPETVEVVLTEGNYLLSDQRPWNEIQDYLDEAWYVDVPAEVRLQRLIQRHIRYGMTAAAAQQWAMGPDEDNARLIESTRHRADRLIPWGDDSEA